MKKLTEQEIRDFLIKNVEPLVDRFYGSYYRASAYLIDGTFLPCVIFCNPAKVIDQAIKRFSETRNNEREYRDIVGSFIGRASVPIYDVAQVGQSPYAWPEILLRQIHGETSMGWTAFTALMRDGKVFSFGTSFLMEFFDLPEGYTYDDITEIHSGNVVEEDGAEGSFSIAKHHSVKYYRERPFFHCYSTLLPSR